MKNDILKLIDRQNDIINTQSDIINELLHLLGQHITTKELGDIQNRINEVS